jgi:prepilin-type N-terminal cleavage/methylation domain-containing protein
MKRPVRLSMRPSSEGGGCGGRESGFTIVEVLAALTIISLCGLLVAGFVPAAIRLGGQVRRDLSAARNLLRLDGEIRSLTAAVATPYWERRPTLEADASGLSIPWYGGRADQVLRFVRRDDAFTLELPAGEAARFPGIVEAAGTTVNLRFSLETTPLLRSNFDATESLWISAVEMLKDARGIPYGLDISYQYRGKAGHTAACFSTLPLEAAP